MNCYLLVGGRSSRMGCSKASLSFGDSTFLGRAAERAGAVFDEVIAVERSDGEPLDGLHVIREDAHADRAPLFGVIRALEDADGKAFLLAIDYPLLTTDLLAFLRDRFAASAALLLAPRWRGKLQMLCAGYDSALLPRLRARVADGRLDLRGLIAEEESEVIEEEELRRRFNGDPLMNVNTPEELEEARSLL